MLKLIRVTNTSKGVQGVFIWNDSVVCHSLELPWLNNLRSKSCIPCGIYPIKKEVHPRFADVIRLSNVPNRSGILIHPGNTLYDTQGCILPGLDIDDTIGIKSSRPALQRLFKLLPQYSEILVKEIL